MCIINNEIYIANAGDSKFLLYSNNITFDLA